MWPQDRKTANVNSPHERWVAYLGDKKWEWRVLKKYQAPKNEINNPYARWFCAVKSPYTHGSYDIGDVYVREIKSVAKLVDPSEVVEEW